MGMERNFLLLWVCFTEFPKTNQIEKKDLMIQDLMMN